MECIRLFETTEEYLRLKDSLILPNLSLCEDNVTKVYFNPYEGGSSEPVLEGNKVLCKYNVTDTSNPVTLYYQESSGGSGSGSGSDSGEVAPMFSSMEVDGIEQEIINSYTFDTEGEHTVLFTLPEGVTSIGEYAFSECTSLTSVTIGNSVTSIGNDAFNGSVGITNITIGNSVTSIGYDAFHDCSGLTSITIPDSVTSISNYAFQGCSGLTSISVAANNQTYDSRNNCNAIIETSTNTLIYGTKNTIIPNTVTSIGAGAFAHYTELTSIIIPNSVTSIGAGAFQDCSGLTSVTIPDLVTSIGGGAFAHCTGLTSITIPNSVTSIGYGAFYECSGLTSVIIGNSVESIDVYAFQGCSGLTSIICNATTAPTIQSDTFKDIKLGGTLTVPTGSTGYDVWMGTGNYYLGKYNWNKVEQ